MYTDLDFTYEGKVYIIHGGKSYCKWDLRDYLKVFPKLNVKTDVLVNPEHSHFSYMRDAETIAEQVNAYLERIDNRHKWLIYYQPFLLGFSNT